MPFSTDRPKGKDAVRLYGFLLLAFLCIGYTLYGQAKSDAVQTGKRFVQDSAQIAELTGPVSSVYFNPLAGYSQTSGQAGGTSHCVFYIFGAKGRARARILLSSTKLNNWVVIGADVDMSDGTTLHVAGP